MTYLGPGVLVTALLTAAPFGPTIAAQTGDDPKLTTLVALNMLRAYDVKCKVLSEPQRLMLRQLVPHLAREVKLPSSALADLEKSSEKDAGDCADKETREFHSLGIKLLDSFLAKVERKAPPDKATDDTVPFAEMMSMWRDAIKDVPPGTLKPYIGCYTGTLNDWAVDMCLTGTGDTVDVTFGRADKTLTCRFPSGEARLHTGLVKTFSWTTSANCGAAPMMQHVGLVCDPSEKVVLDCFTTAFSDGNVMYEDPKTKTLVNGSLKLKRR